MFWIFGMPCSDPHRGFIKVTKSDPDLLGVLVPTSTEVLQQAVWTRKSFEQLGYGPNSAIQHEKQCSGAVPWVCRNPDSEEVICIFFCLFRNWILPFSNRTVGQLPASTEILQNWLDPPKPAQIHGNALYFGTHVEKREQNMDNWKNFPGGRGEKISPGAFMTHRSFLYLLFFVFVLCFLLVKYHMRGRIYVYLQLRTALA